MSKTSDVLVIGGGVVGLSIARRLALDSLRVVLVERDQCGGEASWAGAGIVTPLSPHRGDALAQLQARSVAVYGDFCRAIHEESGVDPEYDRCGELTLAFDDHELSILRADDRLARERPINDSTGALAFELYQANALSDLEPAITTKSHGALECRLAGQVRNPRLLRALRVACERAGVDIREQTPVLDVAVEGERVVGVCTEQGIIRANQVVLCAGAWSSGIGDRLTSLMPVHPVRGQIILLKFAERPFRRIFSYGSTYLVPRRDGRVLLGSTDEPNAGFAKRTTPAGIAALTEVGLRLTPVIADAEVEFTWAGLRPCTPDERPYIGPVPDLDGLFTATGHYRYGLTLAPVTADAVAAMMAGKSYDIDLSACAPGRAIDKYGKS